MAAAKPEETPCSVEYWKDKIAADDDELEDLTLEDIGFVYQSFSIGGSQNLQAKTDTDKTFEKLDRNVELEHSVACLNKALPGISHIHNFLGDVPSYTEGIQSIHSWAKQGKSPYKGTFFTDSDVVANPWSKLHPNLLTWALQNVDLAMVYNPNRAKGYERDNFKKNNFLRGTQSNGLQGGFFAYRNTTRAKLFHGCVEHTIQQFLDQGELVKQQRAIDIVLQSPVGQFVRTHWLPAEFQCWIGGVAGEGKDLSDYVIHASDTVVSRDTRCFFVHSHYVGGLEVCTEEAP
uniref:Uncharacterized protein n=1 Tax=Pseudictyota dubia TaxID=2749911 RepID=A0A7R9ZGC4_9STRA